MAGEQGRDIRNLAAGIDAQGLAYDEGMKDRGLWDFLGNIFAWLAPGIGNVVKTGIDQIAQHNIDVGDPEAIKELETKWTKGLAEKKGTEFEEQIEASETSLLEGILSSALDFGTSKLGVEVFGKLGDKFGIPNISKVQEKTGDWQKDLFSKIFGTGKYKDKMFDPLLDANEPFKFQQGGQVPMQQQKPITISDYFGMQGKSLGGNNQQSLREMLGR